jgi:hypothetical protein
MGPCRNRSPEAAAREEKMLRASYRIEEQTDEKIVIRDVGRECMSVTNDAEAVVRDLQRNGMLDKRRLFYYDSDGQLDELKHDGTGTFKGFAPGPR